jgi:hypothetical protein
MGASFKLDKKIFNTQIEEYRLRNNCNYIDAILSLCEINQIEPETIGKLISKSIKEKIDFEGQQLNLRPKKNSLPL